jgi:anti-sigma regulatory factor (Ser/Thr protein kinase)
MSSVRAARHFVAEALADGVPPAALIDAAALCVTELVANVVRHTDSPACRLTVDFDIDTVRIEVRDDSSAVPAMRGQLPQGEGGRGLMIIDALASAWGVEAVEGDGKAIWIRLR